MSAISDSMWNHSSGGIRKKATGSPWLIPQGTGRYTANAMVIHLSLVHTVPLSRPFFDVPTSRMIFITLPNTGKISPTV